MQLITLKYIDVFDENKEKEISFSSNLLKEKFNEKSLFVTLVDGESMQALIQDKAVLIADLSQKQIEDGKIYIVYYGNKMWVKKAKGNDKFISINEKFSHLVFTSDEVHVVARVLLTFTNL